MTQPLRTADQLRVTQRMISNIMRQTDRKLIVSGMGSGKTGAALDAVRYLLDRFEARHILIIGPRLVALHTWPDEIAAWRHTRPIRYSVAVGTQKEREAAVAARKEITTINFENLQWLAKHIGSVNNWYWDTVIIDESSRLKAGAKRTKTTKAKSRTGEVKVRKGGRQTRFGVLSLARKKIDRIYELTGTPAPNGIYDLWGQIYLMDQGERLGRSKAEFERRWFDKNEYTYAITPRPNAEKEIMAAVADIMVTIPQEKVVEDEIIIPVPVDLPAKAMREYNEFEKTLYTEQYDVEAVSSGVLANKLLQFANGHLYREDRSVVAVHEAKLEALDELVKQCAGENLLVFYSFQFDKDAIKKRFPHAVVANEDADFVKKWNSGKIKLALAHPASIGHGTNLQYGGRIAVWFGLTFNLELWLQANKRLPRPGQTKQVLVYVITAKDTYDERALDALSSKEATQTRVVRSVLRDVKLD